MAFPEDPPAYTEAAGTHTFGAGASNEDGKKDPTFVIGVDFGTTFSSVMWAHSSRPEENPVQQWRGQNADQVPTELHYTDPATQSRVWGYEIQPTGRRAVAPLKWFKLLLQEKVLDESSGGATAGGSSSGNNPFRNRDIGSQGGNAKIPFSYSSGNEKRTPADDTAAVLTALNIPAATVVSHYLQGLRETTLESISSTLMGQEFIKQSKMLWVLTIPAIWSDAAKNYMIEAAEAAGYGKHREDFHFVSEPEAGAVYTLRAIQPQELHKGDSFVILDCGGGTVDLISYKIRTLNPLTIDECVAGTGDLCGSVFLDQGFDRYIRAKLGDDVIDKMSARSRMQMMNSWITDVKFRFGNTQLQEFDVSVPGVPDNEDTEVESGFHTMKAEDVKKIFDPIVDRCIDLVKSQIASVRAKGERVSAVLLVGGFGSSIYLRDRIRAANLNVEVLQPTNAHTAIARGALLRGLDGSIVQTQRVRRWYGCAANTPYSAATHDAACSLQKVWSTSDEHFMVPGHMTWYVNKNDTISNSLSLSFPFYRMLAVSSSSSKSKWVFQDDLLACDTGAPDFKWRNPGCVYSVCQLESDLSGVPRERWRKKWASGKEWWVVEYDLRMRMESEVLIFELVVDGRSYGAVRMRFNAGAEREVVVKS